MVSIEAILISENYRFVRANSGKQALKILLQEFDFAMILMDVKMPNLNGFETAALIYEREKLRHIPIIFITAHSYGEESIFKGYRTGAVDYISKPINPELLKAKVSVFIELYQKNHRLLQQEQKLISINKSLEMEINERKMSEEKIKGLNLELLKSIDRLEAANKDLDRFAFMASHDLQEPLRKIRMFSERLSAGYGEVLDEDGKRYIERIQNSAQRMQVLIKDILTFSKISSEKNLFVESDMNSILSDVLIQLEETVKEKQANIVIDKLPVLFLNPVLIQPLFYNLISNALKYSRKDAQPVIKIYSEFSQVSDENGIKKEAGNNYCRIFVQDNGIGFDQKYAEQIFAMFKRLHHDSEYQGTGIGLALCKKIVEEHNGFISAQSKLNEGSTFIVSLPLHAKRRKMEEQKLTLSE
ncbi:MAG: hybrid sensor histidine kinase/response regulator [Bacteroidota bacterium]|nr:hybrid sensor histidine kinase/response regulator [Bacteroidota bacterium]